MFFQPSPLQRRLQLQISERRLLLIFGDVIAVALACLIALRIWAAVADYAFTLDFIVPQSGWFVLLIGLWLLLASASDFYDLKIAASRTQSFQKLLVITAQMIIVYLLIFFFSPRDALPRLFILYFGIAVFVLIAAWRYARPAMIGWVSEPRRTLILGTDTAACTIIEAIHNYAQSDYQIIGVIAEQTQTGGNLDGIPILGSSHELPYLISRDHITELIVSAASDLNGETFRHVMDAYERGIVITPMAILFERISGQVPVTHMHKDWAMLLLSIQNGRAVFDPNTFIKRLVDILLSLVGLIGFALIFPLLALVIWLDSGFPIFYSQERVGLNGKNFRIYKLRTMVNDAESTTGAVFSKKGDTRVTRIGRFMRKTRIDELPQFYNILRGDMTLVGPRPERPEHMQRLTEKIPFYRSRLIVRPGVTGWAQVRYEYGATDEDALVKLQYDLYYIRHQSLLLDLNIMLRTIHKVFSMSGV
jgi:exopolysaccharide biosynthesis polyprenyl glycosylphosphotransferase